MRAIVLLSGGLDSTVMLALALSKGRKCHALSFDYGQHHRVELKAAAAIAKHYDVSHSVITIDKACFGNASLVTGKGISKNRSSKEIISGGIPSTYVPARNTLFLAYALGQAELFDAEEIYIGCNAMDQLPYPDCRPEFIHAFQGLANVATKQGVQGKAPKIVSPLIHLNKTDIIKQGFVLKAPMELSFSCYDPIDDRPCRACDACLLREQAFLEVNSKQ